MTRERGGQKETTRKSFYELMRRGPWINTPFRVAVPPTRPWSPLQPALAALTQRCEAGGFSGGGFRVLELYGFCDARTTKGPRRLGLQGFASWSWGFEDEKGLGVSGS